MQFTDLLTYQKVEITLNGKFNLNTSRLSDQYLNSNFNSLSRLLFAEIFGTSLNLVGEKTKECTNFEVCFNFFAFRIHICLKYFLIGSQAMPADTGWEVLRGKAPPPTLKVL